jgi:hypothetical protein
MAHKIKNKKSREIIESMTDEAEVNVKEHLKQGAKVMQEMKKAKEQKSNLCQNCNEKEIQKNGLCQECYFSQKIQTAQENHNS